jgi:hypothetical protein
MGEQVAHGRAGRPGGLVEVEHALLGRDQHREGRDRLRHRGQTHRAARVATHRQRALGPGHADGGEGNVPAVDLRKGLHAGGY